VYPIGFSGGCCWANGTLDVGVARSQPPPGLPQNWCAPMTSPCRDLNSAARSRRGSCTWEAVSCIWAVLCARGFPGLCTCRRTAGLAASYRSAAYSFNGKGRPLLLRESWRVDFPTLWHGGLPEFRGAAHNAKCARPKSAGLVQCVCVHSCMGQCLKVVTPNDPTKLRLWNTVGSG
jgi:hypothetical protein